MASGAMKQRKNGADFQKGGFSDKNTNEIPFEKTYAPGNVLIFFMNGVKITSIQAIHHSTGGFHLPYRRQIESTIRLEKRSTCGSRRDIPMFPW